jgi:gliding motility-associated-like protein
VGCVTEELVLTITPSSTNTTNASACDSYTWSVNGTTYTTGGTYSAVVGCVTEVLNLTITNSSTNNTTAASCDSYTWSVNGQTYSSSGTYSELVGCVTEVLNLTITNSSTNTTTASACDSYTWSVNGQTYTSSGSYTAVIGCVTEVLNLAISSPGTACDDGNPTTGNDMLDANCNCIGQLIDCLGMTGGTSLPGTPCDDGNANTVDDIWNANCNCSGTPLDCTSDAGNDQFVCGVATTLNAAGNGQWSGPVSITFSSPFEAGTDITAIQPGTYDLYWTVTLGTCTSTDTVTVIFSEVPDADFAYAQSSYCLSDSPPVPWTAQLGGSFASQPSGMSIDASTGTIQLNNSVPGAYTVTYMIDGACLAMSSQQVNIAVDADASWVFPGPICGDATPIDLNTYVTGTMGGTWSGTGVSGSTFTPAGLNGSMPITYTVILGECTSHLTQAVFVQTPITANAGPDITVCGTNATMNALTASGSGSWSASAGGLSIEPSNSPTAAVVASSYGTYSLAWTVIDGACSARDTALAIFIEAIEGLWVNAGPDQHIAVIDHTDLQGSASSGTDLNWWILTGAGTITAPTDSVTTITELGLGDNLVVLTASMNQCSSVSDTVNIHLDDLLIPEGFSPNGDGVNDQWEVRGIEAYPTSSLQIFNRWGRLVYRSEAYRNEWNGRSRNSGELPDDTYYYVLNLGGDRTYNGHIILKR